MYDKVHCTFLWFCVLLFLAINPWHLGWHLLVTIGTTGPLVFSSLHLIAGWPWLSMKCRWADIFPDWLCCTDWGLFCVLDSKQVDIYGLCIQFCSWYIKLHSTTTMIKRWFDKNLKEKCKQFLLRCFALSSVCLRIFQRWQQASSGIKIKICNNQRSRQTPTIWNFCVQNPGK